MLKRYTHLKAEALVHVWHDRPSARTLLKISHFPGWPHERVAAALGIWQRSAGIDVKWEQREVDCGAGRVPVIVVQLAAVTPFA